MRTRSVGMRSRGGQGYVTFERPRACGREDGEGMRSRSRVE